MKVVINHTESAIFACGMLLIPGTNVVEDDKFDETKSDAKPFIDGGQLSVKDTAKMTDKDKAEAVDNVTNRKNLEALEKNVKGVDTSKAKKKLDLLDEQLKKGA